MKPNYVARKTAWLMVNFKDFLIFMMFLVGVAAAVLALFVIPLEPMMQIIVAAAGGAVAVIFLFWYIIRFLAVKLECYEFYDHKIVYKKGVFRRHEATATFLGVLAIEVNRTFAGRILGYGNVTVDAVGRWDMDIEMVSKPKKLQAYLESRGASKMAAAFAAGPTNVDHFSTDALEDF